MLKRNSDHSRITEKGAFYRALLSPFFSPFFQFLRSEPRQPRPESYLCRVSQVADDQIRRASSAGFNLGFSCHAGLQQLRFVLDQCGDDEFAATLIGFVAGGDGGSDSGNSAVEVPAWIRQHAQDDQLVNFDVANFLLGYRQLNSHGVQN